MGVADMQKNGRALSALPRPALVWPFAIKIMVKRRHAHKFLIRKFLHNCRWAQNCYQLLSVLASSGLLRRDRPRPSESRHLCNFDWKGAEAEADGKGRPSL